MNSDNKGNNNKNSNSEQQILQVCNRLLEFFNSNQRYFEFTVDCALEDRIKFIYKVIFPGFKKIKFYFNFFIARVAQYIDYSPIKVFFYRLIGVKIGRNVYISPDVMIDPHFPFLIEIENHTIIGWGVKIFTHEFTGNKYKIGRINIGEGTVIGGSSAIRCGTNIGKMVDIAFQSNVYKDIPDNTKYGLRNIVEREI